MRRWEHMATCSTRWSPRSTADSTRCKGATDRAIPEIGFILYKTRDYKGFNKEKTRVRLCDVWDGAVIEKYVSSTSFRPNTNTMPSLSVLLHPPPFSSFRDPIHSSPTFSPPFSPLSYILSYRGGEGYVPLPLLIGFGSTSTIDGPCSTRYAARDEGRPP